MDEEVFDFDYYDAITEDMAELQAEMDEALIWEI